MQQAPAPHMMLAKRKYYFRKKSLSIGDYFLALKKERQPRPIVSVTGKTKMWWAVDGYGVRLLARDQGYRIVGEGGDVYGEGRRDGVKAYEVEYDGVVMRVTGKFETKGSAKHVLNLALADGSKVGKVQYKRRKGGWIANMACEFDAIHFVLAMVYINKCGALSVYGDD